MLVNLAEEALKKAGWPTLFRTGRFVFPLGENDRNMGSIYTVMDVLSLFTAASWATTS